jgi:F0F1-type ATP synthase membrane subunit a
VKPREYRGVRTALLAILIFGLIGTEVELLFIGHDESPTQFIPLVLIALGLVVIVWHIVRESSSSALAMRVTMALLIVSGVLGVALHYRGNVQFQKEIDPSIHGYELFMKVMESKAPPALAPGTMAYFGFLGFVCSYPFTNKGEEV